ncbi:hypothetical protein CDD82_5885 [Ophiocordyceps australis]|uniref:Uncharacterized protein n=1 Tax=Ophiocordyceps australis TaxID=1399860 RepID=A0A2C5ZRJ5_9HYPO|nr:hypothetical protein CDD82_5885 [Ophiocordyceps australis]
MAVAHGSNGGLDGRGHDREWKRNAGQLVPRRLGEKSVAVIAIFSLLALMSLFACLLVKFAKVHRRRRLGRRLGAKTDQQRYRPWNKWFRSLLRRKGGSYDEARGSDDIERRYTQHRLGDATSRLGQASRQQQPPPPRPPSPRASPRSSRRPASGTDDASREPATNTAVDRVASKRSVMTLPPYSHFAALDEQVVGREGERAGIDTIEYMPTAEEQEALREAEMEALFRIRLAGRRQAEERHELRRLRNDSRALAQPPTRPSNTDIAHLQREAVEIQESRQRSVSSVSYADVGVARHDGTRLRANSTESERMGLLSDAASMAASLGHARQRSTSSLTMQAPPSWSGLDATQGVAEADLGDEAMPPPDYHEVALDDAVSDHLDAVGNGDGSAMSEAPPEYHGGPPAQAQDARGRDARAQDARVQDARARGLGGVPQLPSLRISRLPSIVFEQ